MKDEKNLFESYKESVEELFSITSDVMTNFDNFSDRLLFDIIALKGDMPDNERYERYHAEIRNVLDEVREKLAAVEEEFRNTMDEKVKQIIADIQDESI